MKKRLLLPGMFICTFLIQTSFGQCPSDNGAAYGGGNYNGLNAGTGFGPFAVSPSSNTGNSGAFVGASNGNGDGSGGTGIGASCWALYANGGATAAAVRPFTNPLNPGATLSFGFDNGFIDNGATVGFGIQNSSGQNLVELYYIGGDGVDAYKKNDNGGQANSSLGFTDDGLTVVFTRTGTSTYSMLVTRLSGGSQTLSGTMKNPGGGQVPAQIRFFNFNAGGGGQRNAYYNNLAIANSSTFSGTGNWTDAARWSCGVPATGDAITIAAGANATLNTDFTVAGSLLMTATSTLTVNPTRTLAISGTADFAGQSVTFLSDGTGTASLGQVNGTLSGATNVTVERFIRNNGFRSWRLLSVPVTSAQTIRQAWQEGVDNPLPKDNNVANRGTQITGVFATQAAAAAAGFDSTSVQAGMLRWNGANWSNITSTNQSINNFSSYFLYVRGDRSLTVTGSVNSSSSTTLRTKGTIYTGDQLTNVGANAFALIPNLYPSAINFTGLIRTGGVSDLFYIWDSKKQNGNSLGVYQTFSNTNSFNCLIGGGSYTLALPNTAIESGQSFFVQSTTAGTITLKESAKISGTAGVLGFRPSARPTKIDTRLYNHLDEMLDANAVVFDAAYSKAVATEDAPKLGNPGANFAVETDSKILAIEGTSQVKENDVVQFRMWNLAQGAYKLEFATSNLTLAEGLTAMLEDSYLGSSTEISMSNATTVKFTIDANAKSSSANRFRIVFAKAKPVVIDTKQSFTIAPNPIENGVMNVTFKNLTTGKYNVRLVSTNGQTVMIKTITHTGGSANQSITLPSNITGGTYRVEIIAADRSKTVQTVFVNKK